MLHNCRCSTSGCPAAQSDPGVFRLSATAVGQAGTSCAGSTFNVVLIDATTGQVQFNPSAPVVLTSPSGSCTVDFTFDVLKTPTKDAGAAAGVQTDQVAGATGQTSNGLTASAAGSGSTTVAGGSIAALTVTSTFPSSVSVGQTGLPASLVIQNASTVDQGQVILHSILLTPSCGSTGTAGACGAPDADPGVFRVSSTGIGQAGTDCAGTTFTVGVANASTGQVQFSSSNGPVVLQAVSGNCTIDFTVDVLKSPTKDADPAQAGTQTDQIGLASGQTGLSATASGTGTSSTTVANPPTLVVTPSFPSPVSVGQSGMGGNLTVQNISTPNQGQATLQTILLTPSCGNSGTGGTCQPAFADPGVFAISSTGIGQAGTDCAGTTFTVGVADASTGQVQFTPTNGPVVLTATPAGMTSGGHCTIDFTIGVNKLPTKDASPSAGTQTDQIGSATGHTALSIATFGNGFTTATVSSGPTARYVARFTATRSGAGITFRWMMVTNFRVAGFTIWTHHAVLTHHIIPAHPGLRYRYMAKTGGHGGYTLHIILARGGELTIPAG